VDLEVRCASACLAVLTDLHYPGWTARVDDAPAQILRANYLLRAVALPAGVHRVSYRYRPSHWVAAASVSAASAAALLVIGLAAFVRRRR
jgi:MprA protease rhombosortase-interaction domain-containing protein